MGSILIDVRDKHLNFYPKEEEFLKPFLFGFDVTFGTKKEIFSTHSSVYILKPEQFIREGFGITNEVMLVYSNYSTMEPRAIQAADSFLLEYPFRNRVDILSYFFVTEDDKVAEWLGDYYLDRQESRIIIPFSKSELLKNKGDSWFVRNRLARNFFDRDLFGYTLPLTEDTYYFGRQQILANYIDSIRRTENRGIFGLRKTGKTSLLFKISRTVREQRNAHVFFYDCKSPSFRKLRWNQFLGEICSNIAQRIGEEIKLNFDEVNIIKSFRHVLKSANNKGIKILLIFDEIEYISFKSLTDKHWESDFIDFWQTMWSAQSVHKNLVYIVAGVNPSIVEVDKVNGIQNPLFGIVQYEYLKGFAEDELKSMLKALGKRMGISFDFEATRYLYEWYGGHPMLTRLACSWINKDYQSKNIKRPVEINKDYLLKTQQNRDADLVFYCKHVVSELQDFYPQEYEMLELLASQQVSQFVEFSAINDYIKHLKSYGLLDYDSYGNPQIAMPVIKRYVAVELAIKEGRNSILKIIDVDSRANWLEHRKHSILRDIRMLEKLIQSKSLNSLFGINSFPEADEFNKMEVVSSPDLFVSFINTCNRCFVESIEAFGRSIGQSDYFWNAIKAQFEGLHYALNRIKVYRNERDHLVLNNNTNEKFLEYMSIDLEGQKASQVQDLYFLLQQRVLDGLLTGIQIEMNKYS